MDLFIFIFRNHYSLYEFYSIILDNKATSILLVGES
jgi:hypothetical protein